MTLYMRVTGDKYELPLAVGVSVAEIARLQGMNPSSIYTAMYEQRAHPERKRKSKFIKVEVDE